MEETDEFQAPMTEATNERPKRNKRKSLVADMDASPERIFKRPSLRRGSSFTFLTPGPQWDFTLKRKRREKDDADAVSLCSFDFKEPCTKRVRPLGRVTSLANLISPVKNGAVRRFGQTLQASFRGDGRSPGVPQQKPCSKAAAPTPPKRRNSTLWSETLDVHQKGNFSTKEIKRQEAIFELSRGEQDLIEDLKLARKAYHDPMLKLSIMSEEELTAIFGDLDAYIPLHEDLLAQLAKATGQDGTVGQIGKIVVDWLPRLNAYRAYCSNQLAAKALLDQKKQDPRVQDFLQRCLESPFSRKLDLWSFLDIPRSRLVKYPLLLKEILRHTPPDHPDTASLEQAISIIQAVLADINMKKGESECQYYIDKLEYLDDRQKDPRIDLCKSLLCHGELRNKSGTKLHVFLFTEVLVLTRPVTRNDRHCYQVYRQPIPVQDLVLEDLQDGDVRMGGSFRGAFSNADKAKNIFRVRFQDSAQGQSHTLQVNDIFHKQQWLNCLRTAMSTQKDLAIPENDSPSTPTTAEVCIKRRSSSISAIMHMEESDENCPQGAVSAPSSPGSESPPSPTPSTTSTLSSSSLSSAPSLPRKSKKDKHSLCSLGKRKETMV
ncbi:neuroepithelial cell-transforming gene 1 protein-like isoform X1 [Myxocyprinus asiaticus]|uniref:neuroepithelial cell-transforming gene 1 protein-like isoform X1 n=1 Tax=Myxocyprinus asiaticus TaxID=70543 RepID=UPI0022239176|nr:neuroepithelial cell-transforming gene 1 protein-like isoform X1 [Myxocyprinus asiaticus]